MRIEKDATYRTSVAIWTVERISPSGLVYVRRDDGRTAQFGLADFTARVVARCLQSGAVTS